MSVVIRFADLFSGCGGTSTGAIQAIEATGGIAELIAVNHWPVAVATHQANHGGARHYCMDLSTAEPEEMVPGRRLDLLVASPECTHFSRARGGKPVNDQRRSGADWVLRWLERLDVTCLLVENVKEFMSWGDLDPTTGLPVKKKNGRLFLEWLAKLRALGYALDFTTLNAADYGDVTTRERFFLIARKDGRPIRWPTPTHSKLGTSDMFGTLPKWRAAREIIDWSDLGDSLLTRTKPLSHKTRLRIARGAQKFWGVLAPLYIRLLDLPAEDEARFVTGCADGPVRTFILGRFSSPQSFDVESPTPTVVGRGAGYLVSPTAEPFVLSRNGHNDPNGRARPASDPLGTVTASGSGTGYVSTPTAEPFVFANRNNAVPVDAGQPIPTATTATGGGSYIVTPEAEPFIIGQQSDSAARDAGQPIMTVSTGGVLRLFSPTAAPFLDVYYATGQADSVDDPLSTATTKPRHALVSPSAEPLVVPYGPRAEARSGDAPLPTVMTKDRLAVATPIASAITPGFAEREGQAPRIHDIDEPLPAIAATGHLQIAIATVELPSEVAGIDPRRLVVIDGVLHLLDIKFRMLKNAELAAAMGFPPDYQFSGNKGDVTRQIGNAVPVGLARALVGAILDPEQSLERAS